jgi:hypothetical protein
LIDFVPSPLPNEDKLRMSSSFYGQVLTGILAACVLASAPVRAADVSKTCYTITVGSTASFSVRGDIFRQALLRKTNTTIGADSKIKPSQPPAGAKRCTVGQDGGGPPADAPTPDATNYFGTISTKPAFRRFSQQPCGTGEGAEHRFFSMSTAIYYRRCTGGAGNGYVYFWGVADENKSDCFADDYPTMFAAADTKKTPVTPAAMSDTYTKGLKITGPSSYALGNAMAAILIAEAYRDVLVIAENYMLMDMKADPVFIIGGRCPRGVEAGTCQNTKSAQNGLHPLAWGGAQDAMMLNNAWGKDAGANSDFGQKFEADLIVSWLLTKKNKVVKEAKQGTCDPNLNWGGVTDAKQKTALLELFAELLPR